MRPYITVIIDSFREAIASRVLWILGIVWTVVLLALIPFSVAEGRATSFRSSSIRNWHGLLTQIQDDAKKPQASPGKQIWSLWDEDFRKELAAAVSEDGQLELTRDLVRGGRDALNGVLDKVELYSEDAFRDVLLGDEAKDLIKQGPQELDEENLAYLNRLLIKSAFPFQISGTSNKEVTVGYLGMRSDPLPLTREQAEPIIGQIVALCMNVFLGFVGIFIGLLVTASMIPKTFEAGAIDLLLSKPVSRPLLFLSKFFGGCVFVLLNTTYFIVGVWLILGFRLQFWNHRILLCVPLFLLSFSVYFCISALAGVKWKNAIVSIVTTIVFWALCWFVGNLKGALEQWFLNPQKLVKLVVVDDSMVAIKASGEIVEWSETDQNWESILAGGPRPPAIVLSGGTTVGPVYDEKNKQLSLIPSMFRRGPRFMMGQPRLTVGRREATWERVDGPAVPNGTRWLFRDHQGDLIAVAGDGILRLKGNPLGKGEAKTVLGVKVPFTGKPSFVPAGPDPDLRMMQPFAAALDPTTGNMAVFSDRTLTTLVPGEDGKYRRTSERKFEDIKEAAVAIGGDTVLVAVSDGRVLVLSRSSLETQQEARPTRSSEPYVAHASPSGRWFAVLYHSGKLWLFDAQEGTGRDFSKGASSVAFHGENLLVADRFNRVIEFKDNSEVRRLEPRMDGSMQAYLYIIKPLHWVFPKPGELKRSVEYAVTDQDTAVMGSTPNLQQARIKINVWGPIWNSLIFEFLLLSFTCIYISRADL